MGDGGVVEQVGERGVGERYAVGLEIEVQRERRGLQRAPRRDFAARRDARLGCQVHRFLHGKGQRRGAQAHRGETHAPVGEPVRGERKLAQHRGAAGEAERASRLQVALRATGEPRAGLEGSGRAVERGKVVRIERERLKREARAEAHRRVGDARTLDDPAAPPERRPRKIEQRAPGERRTLRHHQLDVMQRDAQAERVGVHAADAQLGARRPRALDQRVVHEARREQVARRGVGEDEGSEDGKSDEAPAHGR